MKRKILFTAILGIVPFFLFSQNEFEKAISLKFDSIFKVDHSLFPNSAGKSALTPIGWGGYGTALYSGIGFTMPTPYTTKPDLVFVPIGFSVGNPVRAVNVMTAIYVNDVSKFRLYSFDVVVSRYVGHGSSISCGGWNMGPADETDAGATFYFAYSHAVQSLPSKTPGISKLHYTLGGGSGRSALKSPWDEKSGKGKYGTILFGNISYEVLKNVNINAEWTGINLGFSVGLKPFSKLPGITVGIANVTNSSSDKPNFVSAINGGLNLYPQQNKK